MIEVTFTGETVGDVAEQAAAFAAAVQGKAAAPKAPRAVNPKKAAETPAEPQAAPEPETPADSAPQEAPAADTKALEKVKNEALDKLRAMYASGKPGQAQVKKISNQFGVKKLADVPVEKADELAKAVSAAEIALAS